MRTSKEIDKAIEMANTGQLRGKLGECFNDELLAWILTEVKAMLFRDDGTRRNSLLVNKAKLIGFALKLAARIAKCLFENRKAAANGLDVQP